MDPAPESLPDDVAALKAALIAERARRLEVAAELVVAQAKASEDMALIAAQKLRIAKLERQVFGQRSERSARLIDQLALEFEELEQSDFGLNRGGDSRIAIVVIQTAGWVEVSRRCRSLFLKICATA